MPRASALHAHAATRSLAFALDLLLAAATGEKAAWSGAGRFADEVRTLAASVATGVGGGVDGSRPGSAEGECELITLERAAVETARLADRLARDCEPARVSAVSAAILAESAARIAVEVIGEGAPCTPAERVFRQARRLIEIESSQRRVRTAARLVLDGGGARRVEGRTRV